MNIIKFSHEYNKMPDSRAETYLLEVLKANRKDLHDSFVDYDTSYGLQNYKLPNGEVLILILKSVIPVAVGEVEELWTTIRSWTPEKEHYYRRIRGQRVEIEINEVKI